MYPTDISDQKRLKNLKLETLQLFVEPELYISNSIKNIIKEQPTALYYTLPNPENQIPQLT